jgi:hypothetical protein
MMQRSIAIQNQGSHASGELDDEVTCPHCGRSFACGGSVKKAEGGEVDDEESRFSFGKKRDTKLPRLELDVYRGDDVQRGEDSDEEDEEEEKKLAYARELRRRRGY